MVICLCKGMRCGSPPRECCAQDERSNEDGRLILR
jgi:hypothetical protein